MSDPTRPPEQPPEQPPDQPPDQPPGQPPHQGPYGGPPGQPPHQGPYGGPPGPPYQPGGLTPASERTWASAAHWSALVASFLGGLAFLGPLIVLLVKGNESPVVRRQAVESLNFQLSMLIYAIVSLVLMLLLIGFVLIIVVGVAWFVLTIIGAVRASNGEDYRYPVTIRMVS